MAERIPDQHGFWWDTWRKLRRRPKFVVASALILLIVVVAVFPAWFTGIDPTYADPGQSLLPPSAAHWFGTDPSATPCTGAFNRTCAYGAELPNTLGTAANGTERGPNYREVDLSIFKTFLITRGGQGFDFRADFFNAFNIASYADPTALVTSTSFGQITSTRSPQRQIQLSAKYHF